MGTMADQNIANRIEKLVAEEHELWEREGSGASTPDDSRRLESLQVSLDQCWDLLRQRRALREAGRSPDEAWTTTRHFLDNCPSALKRSQSGFDTRHDRFGRPPARRAHDHRFQGRCSDSGGPRRIARPVHDRPAVGEDGEFDALRFAA